MRDFSIDYKLDKLTKENRKLKYELKKVVLERHQYVDKIKELEEYIRFYRMKVNGMSEVEANEELKDIHEKTWKGKLAIRNR